MKRTTHVYADSDTLAHSIWGILTNPKLMIMCISVSQVLAMAKVMH